MIDSQIFRSQKSTRLVMILPVSSVNKIISLFGPMESIAGWVESGARAGLVNSWSASAAQGDRTRMI